MEITNIYVAASTSSNSSSVGYGTVTFNDILKIQFNIMKTKDDGRLFVNWPSQKGKDDKYYNLVSFVIDKEAENPYEAKNSIEEPIIKEFNKVIGANSTKDKKEDKAKEDEAPSTPAPKKTVGIKFGPKK